MTCTVQHVSDFFLPVLESVDINSRKTAQLRSRLPDTYIYINIYIYMNMCVESYKFYVSNWEDSSHNEE